MHHNKLKDFTSETAREAGKKGKRGPSLKTLLKKALDNGDIDPQKFTKSLYLNAMKGNSGIARLIFDYVDGKPTEYIEQNTNLKGEGITVKFVNNENKDT